MNLASALRTQVPYCGFWFGRSSKRREDQDQYKFSRLCLISSSSSERNPDRIFA